ncbi:hypothetical protein [Candidatus Avelusimicrobium fimicolum]|jgi:ribosomal protein L37E|uniref:hypothetical protein n=1 Tax=Candidatus Avelusimicrobium fimicolum TaxID=3416216 RepID=UPI003D0DDD8C
MALIKCKECGKEYSDMAEVCPNCGYSEKKAKEKETLCVSSSRKNKYAAGAFTLLFWFVGGQYIYLGLEKKATWYAACAQALIYISIIAPAFWILLLVPIIQSILFCAMPQEKFNAKYNRKDSPRISVGRLPLVFLGILIRCFLINTVLFFILSVILG